MSVDVLVPPAEEPVTLAEARAWLRLGPDADDGVVAALLVAAREAFEARSGRALVTRRVRQRVPGPRAAGPVAAGAKPPSAPVGVWFLGADGSLTPAPTDLVALAGDRFTLRRDAPALAIDYDAGHGGAAQVPQALKVALLEAVAAALARRDRDAAGDPPFGVDPFPAVRL
jgi:uncharacterized phiE125 gp8 family phage protein